MVCLVKDGSGYRLETSMQLSQVQAKLLAEFRIPTDAMFVITYTGLTLDIGFTDNAGHQYSLSLNLKDGSAIVREDYGIVRYTITHYRDGGSEVEEEVGYDGTR